MSAAAAGSGWTSPECNDYGRGKCQDPACLWEHCRSGETKSSMEQRQCGSNPRGHQCHEVHERGSQGKSSEAENRSEAYRSHLSQHGGLSGDCFFVEAVKKATVVRTQALCLTARLEPAGPREINCSFRVSLLRGEQLAQTDWSTTCPTCKSLPTEGRV